MAGAREALAAYALEDLELAPIEVGLINLTIKVRAKQGEFVLQRVNPIFSPKVHDDIEAVTAHLAKKGLTTTRLVPTRTGALFTTRGDEVWRVLTFLPGQTFERLQSPAQAEQAGQLLGRFHAAIQDLDHQFQNRRLGVHDTPKHLATLRAALSEKADHPRAGVLVPLGEEILAAAASLPVIGSLPDRVVHGDPKISNLLFAGDGRGLALIDLDTLARMPIVLELGDAFRSWCNPAGEDTTAVHFDLSLFGAAIQGYQAGAAGLLLPAERALIVPATQTIILELAARFAADALYERYFGWDPKRFATRGEHNELRARGQLALFRDLAKVADQAQALIPA
jgi:Ser/Thr protein kinase RdoA (MazF antagonist)